MTKNAADQWQTDPAASPDAGKRVPQIVDPNVLDACFSANTPQYCQVNWLRFFWAFDEPPGLTPPPCSIQIPSERAIHALRRGSADAAGC